MAQPPHFDIDGAIFFVTTRLNEEGRPLTNEEAGIIQNIIVDMAIKKESKLYAYVVMPNHLHVLVQPIDDGISKTMQLLKGRSSRKINTLRETKASPTKNNTKGKTAGGMGDLSRSINVWQKGFFDFTILTEQKFREKFNDIHYNPVKWGLVNNAEEYEYSSASEYKIRYGEVFYT
jgi:REP element-mobilizing transposase RayT